MGRETPKAPRYPGNGRNATITTATRFKIHRRAVSGQSRASAAGSSGGSGRRPACDVREFIPVLGRCAAPVPTPGRFFAARLDARPPDPARGLHVGRVPMGRPAGRAGAPMYSGRAVRRSGRRGRSRLAARSTSHRYPSASDDASLRLTIPHRVPRFRCCSPASQRSHCADRGPRLQRMPRSGAVGGHARRGMAWQRACVRRGRRGISCRGPSS